MLHELALSTNGQEVLGRGRLVTMTTTFLCVAFCTITRRVS